MLYKEEFAAALTRQLATIKYDLIQVDAASMAVYTPLLVGHKKIAVPNDSIALAYRNRLPILHRLSQKLRTRYLMYLIERFEQRFYPQYDACVVVAEADRREIQRLCPGLRVHVIPRGVDLKEFEPQPEQEKEDQLVFTGTMDFEPNVDSVCWFVNEILPHIRNTRPKVTFEIVGRSPTNRVTALAQQPNVIVRGFVPNLRPYLAEAAVFVSPVRFGSGIKGKILEAMAMGKAIVTTSAGTSGIAALPGQDYLIANGAGHFAMAVLGLLEDRDRRRRLAESARAFVEKHYSWEQMAESYESLYLQVAAG